LAKADAPANDIRHQAAASSGATFNHMQPLSVLSPHLSAAKMRCLVGCVLATHRSKEVDLLSSGPTPASPSAEQTN